MSNKIFTLNALKLAVISALDPLHEKLVDHFQRNGFMLSYSLISKSPHGRRNVANGSGAVLTNNGQIRLDLNKDFLVARHQVNIHVSQTWGTNAPSSSDVRRFFSKIELVSNEGSIFTSDFAQFYDLMRFNGLSSAPVVVPGAGGGAAATADFSFNMHHAMAKSHADLLTALQSSGFSTLALVLTVSADAANGFIGGTGTVGAAAYTVTVNSVELPSSTFSGHTPNERAAIKFGKARHWLAALDEKASASAAASNQEVKLTTGGRVRYIALHSYDTTGAIPTLVNGIVDKISLAVNNSIYFNNVAFKDIQQENIDERAFNQTGVAILDMGDDPKGWIPLEGLNEVKLQYSTLGTAPAGWKVRCAQDYATGLKELGL